MSFRAQSNILYCLKRRYGAAVIWRRITVGTVEVTTGIVTTTTVNMPMRAIMLPRDMGSTFSYTLTYLAMNKNFQYGAGYDTSIRDMIFDSKDFGTVKPELTDKIVIGGKVYDVTSIKPFDIVSTSLIVTARATEHGQGS